MVLLMVNRFSRGYSVFVGNSNPYMLYVTFNWEGLPPKVTGRYSFSLVFLCVNVDVFVQVIGYSHLIHRDQDKKNGREILLIYLTM